VPVVVAPACEPGPGTQDDAPIEVVAPVPPEGAELGSQNGPSFGADDTVGSAPPDAVVADVPPCSGQDTPVTRSFHRVPGRRRKRSGRGKREVRRRTPKGVGAERFRPIGQGDSALAAPRPSPGLRPASPAGKGSAGPETRQCSGRGAIGGRHPP
jgi:hypothetical protein